MNRCTIERWLRRGLALLALAPLPAAAACPPPPPVPSAEQLAGASRADRGLLWRIERDGHASYLYGTMHVGKAEWAQPGPAVASAFAASDVVALEIDPAEPGIGAELAAPGAKPVVLPAALKARLARRVADSCVSEAVFAPMPPVLQVLTLSVFDARWLGLDPEYAQEHLLAQRARDSARPVVALETVALQKKVLIPDDPNETLAFVESSLDQLENGVGRLVLARLARAWEEGDLATLDDYERWCDCARNADERAALAAMIDDRNPALADGIAALHRKGRRVFAAVGALHMAGARGLPRLLAARGFTVERLAAPR